MDENRDIIISDLGNIEPYQRLTLLERLFQYVIPKQTSVDIPTQIAAEYRELEALLEKADADTVEKIAQRVLQLQNLNKT